MWAQYKDLGEGQWRLLWVGGIHRENSATPFEVEVVFVEYPRQGPNPKLKSLLRPVEEIPLWGVQAHWINGRCVGYDDRVDGIVSLTVIPGSRLFRSPFQDAAFSPRGYPLFGRTSAAGCWVFQTVEGIELVVPGWQVLQAWYLFDRNVAASVIAGHLDVDTDYATSAQPWRLGTRCVEGHVEYHLPSHIRPETAKAFSRLLFDPFANEQAGQIHKRLMQADRPYLPMIAPPHKEPATWVFRARRLPSQPGKRRLLLLHLQDAKVKPPYESFSVVTRPPNALPEDAKDLPPVGMRRGGDVLAEDAELPLVSRAAGGIGRQEFSFKGLVFHDSLLESIPVARVPMAPAGEAGATALVLPDPDAGFDGISMATEGRQDLRIAGARPSGLPAKPAEYANVLFERTRSAFSEVIAYMAEHRYGEVSWHARFLHHQADDCFLVLTPRPKRFLILEAVIGTTYTYVLDALREEVHEEFPLVMARGVHGQALDTRQISGWLRAFPYAGSRAWEGTSGPPPFLRPPVHVRHQTTTLPAAIGTAPPGQPESAAERHITRLFRDRLISHVTQFEHHFLTRVQRKRTKGGTT